jgi:hypothetical protein
VTHALIHARARARDARYEVAPAHGICKHWGYAKDPAPGCLGELPVKSVKPLSLLACALLALGAVTPAPVVAEGNLAAQPERLETLVLGADLTFSQTEYQLETGKYYRWQIESEGGEEFLIQAPELFRNSWLNQIVINDIEVKPVAGGIYGIEFDSAGVVDVWFVPIRPGNYAFFAAGHEVRGMTGTFVVR